MKNTIKAMLVLSVAPFLITTTNVFACENSAEESKCVQVVVHNSVGQVAPDMVVYLQPLAGQVLPKSSQTITVAQQGEAFAPYITVSQTGKEVHFANKDMITHQIYSADSENSFSFTVRAGSEHVADADNFNEEAEIAMGCNIHDWMSGYLLVVGTPYFAKTDSNGQASFSVTELGKYRVVVWHPQLPTEHHRVSQEHDINDDALFQFALTKKLDEIPTQKNDDDFDFSSDY